MKHRQFRIGGVFYTATGAWVCTDVGTRTVVAVRKASLDAHPNGPPYSIAETAFDEYDLDGCFATEAKAKTAFGLEQLQSDPSAEDVFFALGLKNRRVKVAAKRRLKKRPSAK